MITTNTCQIRPVGPGIRIKSIGDLLSVLPYLIGYHPDGTLCTVTTDRDVVTGVMSTDLRRAAADDAASAVGRLTATCCMPEAVILAGFGPGSLVTPAIEAVAAALEAAHVPVMDMVRAEDGRYWCYLHDHEPVGIAYDAVASVPATQAAANGRTVLPSLADLEATIATVNGPEREVMRSATAEAAAGMGSRARRDGARAAFLAELRDLYATAVAACRNGSRVADSDVARLSVMLSDLRLRDEALVSITRDDLNTHVAVWTDMTRRACVNVAACASLLAYAAWLSGNGTLAGIAVRRALDDDPGYRLADLVAGLVYHFVDPRALSLMTVDELAAAYGEPAVSS